MGAAGPYASDKTFDAMFQYKEVTGLDVFTGAVGYGDDVLASRLTVKHGGKVGIQHLKGERSNIVHLVDNRAQLLAHFQPVISLYEIGDIGHDFL